ncbi:MAG: hypothetical protein WD512_18350 [Candidatus Paceibacterota bacterium]
METQRNQQVMEKAPLRTKRIYREEESHEINYDTGQINKTTKTTSKHVPQEPPYIKLYLDDIAVLHNLPKGSSSLLHELLRQVNYEGLINLNSSVKRKIKEALHYKNAQSVDNGLGKLCKEGLLRSVDRGVYEVNPHLFGKGDWATIFLRRENFSFTVYYDESGNRKIVTDFDKEDSLRKHAVMEDSETGEIRRLTEDEIKEEINEDRGE